MLQRLIPEPERSRLSRRSINDRDACLRDTCLYDVDTETAILLLESCGVAFAWQPILSHQQAFRNHAACFTVDLNHPRWSRTASDMLRDAMPRINHYLRQRIWAEYGEPGLRRAFQIDGVRLIALDLVSCDRVLASTSVPPRPPHHRQIAT